MSAVNDSNCQAEAVATRRLLKRDPLGAIFLEQAGPVASVVRDTGAARPGYRYLAKSLARREAAALARLKGISGLPALISHQPGKLSRSYLPGQMMYLAQPRSTEFFRRALQLLRKMHRAGVAHNDLAKEANWLCLATNLPGIVDFQLAFCSRRRGRLFRLLAREDLRHLLKHKRHYLPGALTAREKKILATPSLAARFWRIIVKPPYHFVTRRLLGWPERHDARERQYGA